jgi:hypothetical protein
MDGSAMPTSANNTHHLSLIVGVMSFLSTLLLFACLSAFYFLMLQLYVVGILFIDL